MKRLSRVGILGVLLVGWYLRLNVLPGRAPWYDEALEIFQALRFPHNFIRLLSGERMFLFDPPTYYALLSASEAVSMDGLWLRLPSLAFGLLAIVFAWKAGACLQRHVGGIGAAFFVALSPTSVYFSQEINQYGLVLGLSALVLYALCRIVGHRKRIYLWILAATIVLGVWTHYSFFFLIPLAFLAIWLYSRNASPHWKRSILWAGLFVLLCVLVLSPLAYLQARIFTSPDVSPLSAHPSVAGILRNLYELLYTLFYNGIVFMAGGGDALCTLHAIYMLLLFMMGLLGLWQRDTRACAVVMLLGAVETSVAFWVGVYPLAGWLGRHHVIWIPFLAFTTSVGNEQLIRALSRFIAKRANHSLSRLQPLTRNLIVLITTGSLLGFPLHKMGTMNEWYVAHNPQINDLRTLLQEANIGDQDTVVVYYGSLPAVAYYQLEGLTGAESQQVAWNQLRISQEWPTGCWRRDKGSACKVGNVIYLPWLRQQPPQAHLRALADRWDDDTPETFWLVFSHVWGTERQDLLDHLQRAGWHVGRSLEGQGAWMYLLESRDTTQIPADPQSER